MKAYKAILVFLFSFISLVSLSENIVYLDGSWEFYWKELYTPQDFEQGVSKKPAKVSLPGSWTTYSTQKGTNLPPDGYATYRKRIVLKDKPETLGLKIPFIWSSSKVWVNGKLVSEKGEFNNVGKQMESEMLYELARIGSIEGNKLEIVVQVVNENFFLGGMYSSFYTGDFLQLQRKYHVLNSLYLVLLGSLFIMGIYHLALFTFRKKNKSSIYFTLLAFLMMIRTMVFGEHYAYEFLHSELGMGLSLQAHIYYVATYMMIIVGLWYISSLYPAEANKMVIKYYTWGMMAVFVFMSVFPIKFVFTHFLPELILFGFGAIYTAYILIMAIVRKRKQFGLQILGIAILLYTGLNDILYVERIYLTGLPEAIPLGFVLFLLVQMIIMARDFSSTYTSVEELTLNLEQKVMERTSKLNAQRKELKVRNDRINESIDYASKIQHSMLPSDEVIKEKFPESFVFYRPKDVLSGDFYFVNEIEYKGNICSVFVVADCTGHGIPGAMMSMMGNSLLNRLLLREENKDPGHILTKLDQTIQNELKQSETDNHDGMDISIAYVDKKNKVIYYATANSYIAYMKDGEMATVRGENSGVGGVKDEDITFSTRIIEWKYSINLFMFSDGFQDQFGGSKGKKFQKGKFHQLLKDVSGLPITGQYESIENSFNFWKGENEQVDDVLVVGMTF